MLNLNYDISGLIEAQYNPRKISEQKMSLLIKSIKELGIVKPLIVRGKTVVAGHQRFKALISLGISRAPVYELPIKTTLYDEIRFNQIHNGTGMDCGEENVIIKDGFDKLGFCIVQPERITGNFRAKYAIVRNEICDLIIAYGPWGSVVATKSGKVIHCAQYALASFLVRSPLTVYVIPDSDVDKYNQYLCQEYGSFYYEHLKRNTFIQSQAQLWRLRGDGEKKNKKSALYENFVIPYLKENQTLRCLDFGSGRGEYAQRLKKAGFNIKELEFYKRNGNSLDLQSIHTMIDDLIEDILTNGPYDVVICDSVLNSVDSVEAEKAVLCTINILCKPGGMVFISGRKREYYEEQFNKRKLLNTNRWVQFLDKDGLTALYRGGYWFYQKYHTAGQAEDVVTKYGFQIVSHERSKGRGSWQIKATKVKEIPFELAKWAIVFEFNLPISETMNLNRHKDAEKILYRIK